MIGSAGNDALREALGLASMSCDALAEVLGVDTRTVQRWLGGRTPHARHRWALAAALGVSERRLWPAAGSASASVQVLSGYRQRADLPAGDWWRLFEDAAHHIDLLGIALLFLPEQHPRLVELLWRKAAAGCIVRLCLADPRSPFLAMAEPTESESGLLRARIRTAVAQFRRAAQVAGLEVRLHNLPVYNSVFRFDDQLLVATHLYSTPGHRAPLIRLRRRQDPGMYEAYMEHFDAIWRTGRRAAGRPIALAAKSKVRRQTPGQLALLPEA